MTTRTAARAARATPRYRSRSATGSPPKLDRVETYSLDLAQATSCGERKIAIEKLAASSDKRAVAALRRAKAHKCVEQAASDAIARLEAGS